MGEPALLIYASVYGNGSFTSWETGLKSLRWPKNHALTKEAEWRVWTSDKSRAAAMLEGFDYKLADAPLNEALVAALTEACERKIPLLMAPPDLIFGDGSIRNMLDICLMAPCRAVAAGHVRVLPSIAKEISDPLGNAQLVSLAWKHLHPVFRNSDASLRESNGRFVGTSWMRLTDEIVCATFHIPTVHLLQVIREDVDYFSKNDIGHWDHQYPTELIKVHRQKLIGSSDAAFMCEITADGTHSRGVLAMSKPGQEGPDWYRYGQLYHCHVNANTSVILRSC